MQSFDTLTELLRRRATDGSQGGYRFLSAGREVAWHDYAKLDARARAIGASLDLAERRPVLLLFAPGLDFIAAFFGALYGGGVPVPAYPPDPSRIDRTLPRLLSLVADADPAVILTTSDIAMMAEHLQASAPDLARRKWIAVDTVPQADARWEPHPAGPDDLCFLQYTSGSTGSPKGVMVTHRNVAANQEMIAAAMGNDETTVGVSWLPMYHDMGLVGHIIQPLYLGIPSVLMSPIDFLKQPLLWLNAITEYRGTTSGGPNFAFDRCVRKISDEELRQLDLSSWRTAYCGAEPVRTETMRRFQERFAAAGLQPNALFPCYGLAEATLLVSGGDRRNGPLYTSFSENALQEGRVEHDANGTTLTASGKAALHSDIVIVDTSTLEPAAPGAVGEIWVRGAHIAAGYYRKPEATQETFGGDIGDGRGRFLRTGDLGFIRDGQLYVTGRLKDLLVLRGRNHYPQDIETTVERSHSSLRPGCSAAFTVDIGSEARLVVTVEVERRYRPDRRRHTGQFSVLDPDKIDREQIDRRRDNPPPGNEADDAWRWDPDEVVETIRQAIWNEHELLVHAIALIVPGTIAKTSSGKIQRQEVRRAFLEGELQLIASRVVTRQEPRWGPYSAPQNSMEEAVASIWQLVLAVDRVGRDDSFVELGGDSVKAAEVVWQAQQRGLRISMRDIFEHPTVARLAKACRVETAPETPTSNPPPIMQGAPLTPIELDLLERKVAEQPWIVRVRTAGDPVKLRKALQGLAQIHRVLSAAYSQDDGGAWRRSTAAEVPLQMHTLPGTSSSDDDRVIDEVAGNLAQRTMEGTRALWAAVLCDPRPDKQGAVLVLGVHPYAVDEIAMLALLQDLGQMYDAIEHGKPLPTVQGTTIEQWGQWTRTRARSAPREVVERWTKQLSAEARVLPTRAFDERTAPAPRVKTVVLDDVSEPLHALVTEEGVNVLDVLVTAVLVSLRQYHGGNDAVRVDVMTSGRDSVHCDLSRTVARTVHTSPIAIDASELGGTLSDALGQVQRHVEQLKSLDAPFCALRWFAEDPVLREQIVSATPSQVVLRFQAGMRDHIHIPGLGQARITQPGASTASGDLEIVGLTARGKLSISFHYDERAISPKDVDDLVRLSSDVLRKLIHERTQTGPSRAEQHPEATLSTREIDIALARALAKRKGSKGTR